MSKLDLVIFDCDGVLVDSEYLSGVILAELISNAGAAITPDEIFEHYAGLVLIDVLKKVEHESGVPLSLSIVDQAQEQFLQRIPTDLMPIDGVREAIEQIDLPRCICSNSRSDSIKAMLTKVGLYDLFEGHIFSAPEVGNKQAKPDPNVYLTAAKSFNIAPARTVVIEDSVHGVHGAVKAGMRVIGFTGGSHAYPGLADRLTEAGAETVISRHHDLPSVIQAMNEWQDL